MSKKHIDLRADYNRQSEEKANADATFAKVLAAVKALPPTKNIHGGWDIQRAYPNGPRSGNIVRPADLISHIYYNFTFRPGCSLYVDGILVYAASLREERHEEHVASIMENYDPNASFSHYPYE